MRYSGLSLAESLSRFSSEANLKQRRIFGPRSKKRRLRGKWANALHAFEDVENALANDYYLRMREGALGTAVSSSADTVKFGRQQLEQGQVDMFTVLRLTGENLAAKVQLTAIRASRLRERVNLYLALGGDFEGTGAWGK